MSRPNASQRMRFQRGEYHDKPTGFKGLGKMLKRMDAIEVGLLPALGELMYESIVDGSVLTGAPGQPEDEGDLIDSWEMRQPSPTSVAVISDSTYAVQNETGVRKGGGPYVQRSAKGGRFSVALTRNGLPRLAEAAAQRAGAEVSA